MTQLPPRSEDTFSKADLRSLLMWVVIGTVGLAVYLGVHKYAFPQAAVNLTMERHEAVKQSRAFLEARAFDIAPYRHAVAFSSDWHDEKFLEKEANHEEMVRLMGEEMPPWSWNVRWFVPHQEEEFTVAYTPDGRLDGFEHVIPEAAEGASLDAETARTIAETFLTQEAGVELANYKPLEATQKKYPHRLAHTFKWERLDFGLKGAKYEVSVTVDGDAVASYGTGLHIPEQWLQEEGRKHSQRHTLTFICLVVAALIGIGAGVVLADSRAKCNDSFS